MQNLHFCKTLPILLLKKIIRRTQTLIKMKKLNFPLFLVVFLCNTLFILVSCNKDNDDAPKASGFVHLSLSIDGGITVNENNFKSANLDEFLVNIFTSDHQLFLSYNQVTDVPDVITLDVGSYYVEVSSNNLSDAAFESAYYRGVSEVFAINTEETSEVSVVCTLANIAVSVEYTQNVKDDFEDFNTTVSSPDASLVYAKDETRIGYFAKGPLHVECVLSYRDAQNNLLSRTITTDIDNPEIQKHYGIQIDLSLSDPEATLNITLDESVELETIVLSDEGSSDFAVGDIIMTEFMANPDILADGDGEWMEFYNTTSEAIDLQDWTITRVGSSSTFTINQSLIILAGDFIVFAVDEQATDQMDYDYSSFSLTNTSGQIQLASPAGTIVSDISYTSAQVSAGRAAQLNPDYFNAVDYDNMSNWNLSSVEYITGNTGSPGQMNESF